MRHKLKSWKRGRKKERKREQNEKWRKATSSSFVYPGPFTLWTEQKKDEAKSDSNYFWMYTKTAGGLTVTMAKEWTADIYFQSFLISDYNSWVDGSNSSCFSEKHLHLFRMKKHPRLERHLRFPIVIVCSKL